MASVFSQQILEAGTDSESVHIPGLNAMRQDLLVHVPSGNIMIWKSHSQRGNTSALLSSALTKWNRNVLWCLKWMKVQNIISLCVFIWYLRPFPIRRRSTFDLLDGLPPRVLIRAGHKHGPNELDKSWKWIKMERWDKKKSWKGELNLLLAKSNLAKCWEYK